MADLKVYMKELGEASWIDVSSSCLKANFKIRKGFGSLGSDSDVSKLSIEYKADDIASATIFHASAKQIRVETDGVEKFEGYTLGDASVRTSPDPSLAWVKLSAYPYAHIFEESLAPATELLEGYKVLDSSDTANSLVHILLNRIISNLEEPYKNIVESYGYAIDSDITISSIANPVLIEEGDSYLDILNEICSEFGLAYYFDGNSIKIVKPYEEDDRIPTALSYGDVLINPSFKTKPYKKEKKYALTIARIITGSNETVFQLREEGESASESEKIPVNGYYPEEANLEADYSTSSESETLEFLYATGLSYEYLSKNVSNETVTLVAEVEDLGNESASFRFKNTNDEAAYLNQLTIEASTVYYKDTSLTVTETNSKARDIDEHETRFLSTSAEAEAYIKHHHAEDKSERFSASFSSDKVAIEPNSLVTIGTIPFTILVRYTEENLGTGIVEYSGVAYSVEAIGATSVVKKNSATGALQYINLSLDGFAYTYDSDGNLSPADQLIHATVKRFGIADNPVWKINNTEIASADTTINVPASYLTGNLITVSVKVGEFESEEFIYKITNGSKGESTVFEWCLSASSTVFTEANKLRLYEYDSSFMLWDTYPLSNSSLWQRTKPQPTTELPYIWERVSEDSGVTWSEPYCISINPFSSITLEASQLAYKILATGYVLEAQSIAVSCKKLFTNEPCYWIVKKGSETTKLSNVNTISIDIPVGATYRFIDVTCICDGKSRSLRIIGEAEALPTYQKLSTININDLASTTTRDDGSPLVVGDYRLVLSGEYHLPYTWDGSAWKGASPTDSNYGHVVSSLAPDVWASDQTIPSISAIYGFYKSLFSSSLLANTLTVGSNRFLEQLAQNQGLLESIGSDATVGTQLASNTSLINNEAFKQAMAQNPLIASVLLENPSFIESIVTTAIVVATTNFSCAFGSVEGIPTFDIAYGGNTIFRIDPSTGRVFIGKPNSNSDGAETGFMYDPSTQSISSKNNKLIISSEGRIIATDGQFAGEINASSGQFTGTINSSTGFFGGHLDTPSFSALPSTTGTEHNFSLGSTATDQTTSLLNLKYSLNLEDGMYRVNLSADSTIKYMDYKILYWNLGISGTKTTVRTAFYTSEMSLVGRIESLVYEPSSSTWDGVSLTLDIFLGAGDVFVFKDIPRNPSSTDLNLMETGQVYSDSTGTLKIKL